MASLAPAKKVLITGTSTGVGQALAVSLAKNGHIVWATMRNLDKKGPLEEAATAAGASIIIKELDVEKSATVNKCVEEMISTEGSIDCLINNAGAGFVRTLEQATDEELNWVMDINFMGVVRCIKAVIPHMRSARCGHIINITSVGGLVGQPFNEMYCAAKFAVEGLTESMASYLTPGFNIKFTAIEPGGISTAFRSNITNKIEATGGILNDDYAPLLQKYMTTVAERVAKSTNSVYQTAQEVADVIVECVENPNPPVRCRTSPWSEEFCALKTKNDPDGKLLQDYVIETMLESNSTAGLG